MPDSPGVAVGSAYETHVADYRTPFAKVLLNHTGAGIDLTGKDVEFSLDEDDGTNVIAWTSSGVSIQPTKTFTVDATNDFCLSTDHGLENNDEVVLSNSGGALPSELATSTIYKVQKIDAHSFKLKAVGKSSPITFSGVGTGTHSFYLVGYVHYQWQSGDLAAATEDGTDHKARFRVEGSTTGQYDTYPREGWWPVRVNVGA